MLDLLQIWALVECIGLASLPLTVTVFRNVPDRGWAWSKALGIILLSFCTWFPLVILRSVPYNRPVLTGIALVLLAIMIFGFLRTYRTIREFIRTHIYYIIATELIFLVLVFMLGYMRSYGPAIYSFEEFMDSGILASIMRGPTLPPHDMWFAGEPINYYYYAHYAIATLATIIGQPASIAFNTGICILFGLTGSGLFGVTCNIVAWAKNVRAQLSAGVLAAADASAADIGNIVSTSSDELSLSEQPDLPAEGAIAHQPLSGEQQSETPEQVKKMLLAPLSDSVERRSLIGAMPFGLSSVLLCLILGNLAAGVDWWNSRQKSFYDWFAPSRVIPKTVNEFPAFSFLLSDFHAHTLTLAFTILTMGVALNLFLAPHEKGLNIYGHGWRLPLNLICSALVLGSIAIMNSWDYPTYAALILLCIGGQQWLVNQKRFSWTLVMDIFSASASLIALSFLFFLPFYLNFVSPAQGIGLVSSDNRSPLGDELLIYGLSGFLFLTFLVCSTWSRPLLATIRPKKDLIEPETDAEGNLIPTAGENKIISWSLVGTLCGLGFIVIGLIFQWISPQNATVFIALGITIVASVILLRHADERTRTFALLAGAIAFALITGCEIIFLRDVFADQPRYNTVFKFYFQAWALLSVASGAGLYFIIERFRQTRFLPQMTRRIALGGKIAWTIVLLALVAVAAVYPIVAPQYRYLTVNPTTGKMGEFRTNSLDGIDYLKNDAALPGDYQAIRWINANIQGDPGIIETIGNSQYNDYSNYDRISAMTGLSTPMGWIGHEYQWRIKWYDLSTANELSSQQRVNDINTIYTSPDNQQVISLMQRYNVQYLYVGYLERQTYPHSNLDRFASFMQIVYHDPVNNVTIYKIR